MDMVKHIDNKEFKVVDSQIITPLSDETMKELQLKQNDKVALSSTSNNNQLVIQPVKKDRAEFNKMMELIADENDEIFKGLVER